VTGVYINVYKPVKKELMSSLLKVNHVTVLDCMYQCTFISKLQPIPVSRFIVAI